MWRRSAAPTSAGTGTTGTPAIRQPVMASTVVAVGVASTATRCGAADAFGHRRRGADEVAAAQRRAVDAHGVGEVVSGGDGRGVQRGQQHVSEATAARSAILGRVDPIERVASREVYRNAWMIVREDDIRRPDGSLGIYGVIDKPTYALVIARDGDRYRLVEQFRYPIGLRRWEFPQGTAPGRSTGDEPTPAELAAARAARGDRAARRVDGGARPARRRARA